MEGQTGSHTQPDYEGGVAVQEKFGKVELHLTKPVIGTYQVALLDGGAMPGQQLGGHPETVVSKEFSQLLEFVGGAGEAVDEKTAYRSVPKIDLPR
ncbi:hypothetical protein ES703_119974 [subsurface metagenome]